MVLEDLNATIDSLEEYDVEVICVDDRSTDRTAEIARSFGARVVSTTGASGKGLALRQGFAAAKGEIIAMLDADYSHRTEDLPRLLEAFDDTVGLVIGSRAAGGSEDRG